MQVTPDMPAEPGGTVAEHGSLLALADFIDDDSTGIKAEVVTDYYRGADRVRIKVDSFDPFGKTIWLDADDTEGLGLLLIKRAKEIRAQAAA